MLVLDNRRCHDKQVLAPLGGREVVSHDSVNGVHPLPRHGRQVFVHLSASAPGDRPHRPQGDSAAAVAGQRCHPPHLVDREGLAGLQGIYKNLHRDGWSIKALDGLHRGKVVGHAQVVALTGCTMRVGKAAAARIAAGHAREVHAWVTGIMAPVELRDPVRLVYHPHERPEFYAADTGQAIWEAPGVVFAEAAYIERCPG